MAFENDTNRGRVQKMVETLALITKSAESNRAKSDDVAEMLRPLTDALSAHGVGNAPSSETRSADAPRGSWTGQAPQWASVRDMAEQADLKDLTVAMAVCLNRIDEALS